MCPAIQVIEIRSTLNSYVLELIKKCVSDLQYNGLVLQADNLGSP